MYGKNCNDIEMRRPGGNAGLGTGVTGDRQTDRKNRSD